MTRTIVEVRGQISGLQGERAALNAAPQSHEDTRAAILAHCVAQAEVVGDRLRYLVSNAGFGGPLDGMMAIPRQSMPGAPIDLLPPFVGLFGPEHVAAALGRYLEGTESGPTAAQRAERLASIDARLFALELEEERLVRASEAAGAPYQRRPDASPAAVLFLDEGDDQQADEPTPAPRRKPARSAAVATEPGDARRPVRSEYLRSSRRDET